MKKTEIEKSLNKRNGAYYKVGYLSTNENGYAKESEMLVRVGIAYHHTKEGRERLSKIALGEIEPSTRKSPVAEVLMENKLVKMNSGKICLIAYPTKNSHIKTISTYSLNGKLITKEEYEKGTKKRSSGFSPMFYLDIDKIQWIK